MREVCVRRKSAEARDGEKRAAPVYSLPMCELLAMSANRPAEVGHYLSRLMARGGATGPHADGWGVAYYEDRAVRIFKEPAPAAESRLLAMLAEDSLKSTALIAHIRRANPSMFGRATKNTHPFEREWNGRSWSFAHSGKLPGCTSRTAVFCQSARRIRSWRSATSSKPLRAASGATLVTRRRCWSTPSGR